jgi:hypothetical protein
MDLPPQSELGTQYPGPVATLVGILQNASCGVRKLMARQLRFSTSTIALFNLFPTADGGVGISSFFDITGEPPPKAAATLRLLSRKELPGGVTGLRYRVAGQRVGG